MLLTRGLRLLGAFDKPGATPSASLVELRRRRAVILLQKGFNKACVEDWNSAMICHDFFMTAQWGVAQLSPALKCTAADIAEGELLIASRPIELIRPGDPDWQYHADMAFLEEVLTRRLLQRCMDCDAQCVEEVFTLFDGQAQGKLSSKEKELSEEADRELSRCAAFWISGGTQNSGSEWKQLLGSR
eukprot:Skav203696  [mRNA]  locus=scaffold259:271280:282220:+ [translate_table: standard]